MVKAKDIMTSPVVNVKKDTPMYEAAQLLSTNNITGVPVVDDDMTLVGMITEKDILDLFDVLQYAEDRTVNSSMSREVVSFDVKDDLDDICHCLKTTDFRRIPVIPIGVNSCALAQQSPERKRWVNSSYAANCHYAKRTY